MSDRDVWITNCVKHWISPDIQSSLSSTTPEERFELFDNGLHGGKTKLLNLLAREQRWAGLYLTSIRSILLACPVGTLGDPMACLRLSVNALHMYTGM